MWEIKEAPVSGQLRVAVREERGELSRCHTERPGYYRAAHQDKGGAPGHKRQLPVLLWGDMSQAE